MQTSHLCIISATLWTKHAYPQFIAANLEIQRSEKILAYARQEDN